MKNLGAIIGAAVAIAALGFLAWRSQRTLELGLPPRTLCASVAEAWEKAAVFASEHGGRVLPISGTGSMAPFIPAAAPGRDPRVPVAFAVSLPRETFADVSAGRVCVYRAKWANGGRVIHGAAERDSGGWIMSGLNNERSESWERMTAENFECIAAHVFTWAQ